MMIQISAHIYRKSLLKGVKKRSDKFPGYQAALDSTNAAWQGVG